MFSRTHAISAALLSLAGCIAGTDATDDSPIKDEPSEAALQGPLPDDFTPEEADPSDDGIGMTRQALEGYYTFGMGSGLDSSDFTRAKDARGFELKVPPASFLEATYSSRLAQQPESMWVTNGDWLQTGALLDGEQTEIHYTWQADPRWPYWVSVQYEVSSESNYDYLWINSTASDGSCNAPGVVRTKVSGEKSGSVSFVLYPNCPTHWLGIYYIKDGSVASGGDYARIKSVNIWRMIPVGIGG